MAYRIRISLKTDSEVNRVLRRYEEMKLGFCEKVEGHSFVYVFKDRESMRKGYEILKKTVLGKAH
ncbi:MAG: hypothetical protein DRJ31_09290 [Candidatus Methanomethylicota archaeon]|uniref:Uncharacterized protein n=1 Tax=Thermoproteota archaeon TaxID=2056631 RepID=A0A497EKM2_9CREN|nr:MAG: hypothetical protein DRJ31_09290 [Candidatus Verstraetearchaeota archaeon]